MYKKYQLFAEEPAETSQVAPDTEADATATEDRTSFDDLIKGDYKEDYENHVREAIGRRFRNSKNYEAQIQRFTPALQMLGQKYGIDATEINEDVLGQINDKILADNSYYEDGALEAGMDVDTFRNYQNTLQENALLRRMQEQKQAQDENRARFENLNEQANALKELYPDFDLDKEMMNPEFERLTWNAGVPLQTAFEVIHRDEFVSGVSQFAAQQTQRMMANSIASGKRRPSEGANGAGSAATANVSPKNWTKEQRKAIKERVKNGERVVL